MNFIGFDEMRGNGTAPVLFNRVVILPPPRETAGKWIHPAAGFIPGQQPYLKPRVQIYNRSLQQVASDNSKARIIKVLENPGESELVRCAPLLAADLVDARQHV